MRHQRSPKRRCTVPLLLAVALPAAASSAGRAACTGVGPPLFGQLTPECGGAYCYVVSPGLGTDASIVSSFWSFGYGSPSTGRGDDSGAWGDDAWLRRAAGGLYLAGDWNGSPSIDGCIVGRIAPGKAGEIMMTVISDQNATASVGYFAAAGVGRNSPSGWPDFDFTFAAGGGSPRDITLVAIPRATLVFSRPDVYHFFGPTLGTIAPGLYADASIESAEMARWYRIYRRNEKPTSLARSDGWIATSPFVPLGMEYVVPIPCPPTGAMWFATVPVFDSGFETAHVSTPTMVVCDRCATSDHDFDGFPSDPECGELWDCDDSDPNVHPGALELCNGIDDNCDGITDNVLSPASVRSMIFTGRERMTWEQIVSATAYDVVRGDILVLRGTAGDFTGATDTCLADDIPAPGVDDPEAPKPDAGFWYLVRAVNCAGPGSYDGAVPPQSGGRDDEIAASGHGCP